MKHLAAPVQKQDFFGRNTFIQALTDFLHTIRYIFLLIDTGIHYDLVLRVFGSQNVFFDFIPVVFNHLVAGAYDVLRTAIIQVEFDDGGRWEMFFKLNDIIHIGAPESVDTLPVITHTKKLRIVGQQEFDQINLEVVDVLEFVDQHVWVSRPNLMRNIFLVFKQRNRSGNEVVKIQIGFVDAVFFVIQKDGNGQFIKIPDALVLIFASI